MIRSITGIPASLAICLALIGLAMPSYAAQPAPPPPDHMMPLKAKSAPVTESPAPPAPPTPEQIEILKLTRAIIQTKYGNIELAFFPDIAPVHVANFVKLAREKFYKVAFRKKLYHSIEEIQADLDEFMRWYNNERTNQGRYCQGRTPMETFLAGIDLYREFVYDEEVMREAA